MVTCVSVSRLARPLLLRTYPKHLLKPRMCPLYSTSFTFCLNKLPHKTPTPSSSSCTHSFFCTSSFSPTPSKSPAATSLDENPLLREFDFPPYDVIEPKHVQPGIRALLKQLEGELDELEKTVEPSWPKLVEPLEKIVDRLRVVWGVVNHLKYVKDSAELRSAIEQVQPQKVQFLLRLGQSKPIYNAFKAIQQSPSWNTLSEARKRVVEAQIKEAVLNGISLKDDKREHFNRIQQELEKSSKKFEENLLDATKKFEKLITEKKDIEGLPATALGLAAQTAVSKGHENATAESCPWVITLDLPSYVSVLQHARNRSLREEVYRAYLTRSSSGDLDNTPIINQILKLRLEKAKLLGYNNYAEMSMVLKMATVDKAEELLEKLRSASWNPAVQDLEDLKNFLRNQNATEANDLSHWDVPFWSERLRESKYDINELGYITEAFPSHSSRFGTKMSDFIALKIPQEIQLHTSILNFDPYSRPSEKRGGAWMNEVVARSRALARDGVSSRLPVAQVVCNQTPPVGDKPSLMTFYEIQAIFHEFGHALQHMLTKEDEGLGSGIRVIEWDAVELPSQFMENWCYERNTLMSIAKHYETGETLPEQTYVKLLAAKTFQAGSVNLHQIRFASLDLELHTKYVPGGSESIFDIDQRVSKRTQVLPPLPEDRFLCGFVHIFAAGYAAGYYSYKWAEVLSADAFLAFEDVGLNNDKAIKETGKKFRETILAHGGGKPPLEVFVEFRGREPSPEALLRHNGLLPVAV